MDAAIEATRQPHTRWITLAAWSLALTASLLPVVLWDQITGMSTAWLGWVRITLLAVVVAVAIAWKALRPLRDFAIVLLIINAGSFFAGKLNFTYLWIQRLLGSGSLVATLQPDETGKLAITFVMLLALLALRYSWRDLYLTAGKLDAPITPIKWLGFPKPDPWWKFGLQYGFYIPLGIAVVMWLAARPTGADFLQKVVPVIPAILLFAALNALYEEFVYRASMLAVLESAVGIMNAWWISAVFFGIGHFYGVPYGWVGILLATFTGWLWGKAMVETRGFAWAWWMHFLMDVIIFTFMAVGAVTPGG